MDSFKTDFVDVVLDNWKDTAPWIAWLGWPNSSAAGDECSDSFLLLQVICIGRWVLMVLALGYTIFVIFNIQFINDAVNCVKMAAIVLAQNIVLIIQPVYNIFIKIIILGCGLTMIMFALSGSEVSPDTFKLYLPDPDNLTGNMVVKTVSGIARTFDMMYSAGMPSDDPAKEYDVY